MPTISKGLTQAYELQDFTHSAAIALKEGLRKEGKLNVTREDAQAICSLVKAWEACQERIRIHRNKPMPGSLRPIAKPKKVRTISNKPLEQLPTDTTSTVQSISMLKESTSTVLPSPPSTGVESV